MSGQNLIVIKNSRIAFSDYLLKDNKMPIHVGLERMIVLSTQSIYFPLHNEGLSLIHIESNGQGKEKMRDPGPYVTAINSNSDLKDVAFTPDLELSKINFRLSDTSMFVRGTKWHLESAATAAAIIYDDVGKIYEEAYYANGITPPPFYVGSLSNICGALDIIPSMIYWYLFVNKGEPGGVEEIMECWEKAKKRYSKNAKQLEEDMASDNFTAEIACKIRRNISRTFALEQKNSFNPD